MELEKRNSIGVGKEVTVPACGPEHPHTAAFLFDIDPIRALESSLGYRLPGFIFKY